MLSVREVYKGKRALASKKMECSAHLHRRLLTRLCGANVNDTQIKAERSLLSAIEQLNTVESGLKSELVTISERVKFLQKNKSAASVRGLLNASRAKRQNLANVMAKKDMMQRQYDAVMTSELNQKIVSSMRDATSALKSMGVSKVSADADEIMMDLEENVSDVREAQNILSTPIDEGAAFSEEDLNRELELLMGDNENLFMTHEMNIKPLQVKSTLEEPPSVDVSMQDAGPSNDKEPVVEEQRELAKA